MDLKKYYEYLPVLKKKKNPVTALIIGFLFGAIGLAIYFRKLVDFFVPIIVALALGAYYTQVQGVAVATLTWVSGAAFAAAYGFFRVIESNERLAQQSQAAGPPSSAVGEPCAHCGTHSDPAAAFCPACGTGRAGAASPQVTPDPAPGFAGPQWWENPAGDSAVASSPPPPPPQEKTWWNQQ